MGIVLGRLLTIILKHGLSWWIGLVSSGGLTWAVATYTNLRKHVVEMAPALAAMLPENLAIGLVALVTLAWVIVTLALRIDRSNATKPRIFFGEPTRWDSPLWREPEHKTMLVPKMSFLSTVITNDPISKSKEGSISGAYCVAEFFNKAGDCVCTVRHARWHDGEKPRKDYFPGDETPRFFPRMNYLELKANANPEQIDFALKDVSKAGFHGFPTSAQDIYSETDPGMAWQDEGHKMPPGKYKVILTIRGNEINAPYPSQILFIENAGVGHELTVTWPDYQEAKNWFGAG